MAKSSLFVGLPPEQARRRFWIFAGGGVLVVLGVPAALSIGYWQTTLTIAGILLWLSSWLRVFYSLGWPDSRPRFPFSYLVGISITQRALVDFAAATLVAAGIMTLWPSALGFAAGALIVAMSAISSGLLLIALRISSRS